MDASIVRIFKDHKQQTLLGAGVLISGDHILTCAHVAGLDQNDVYLDFPLVKKLKPLKAQKFAIFPPKDTPEPDNPEDICILKVRSEDLPDGVERASFLNPKDDLTDRHVRMFGFPQNFNEGDWVKGKLIGRNERGWFQLDHDLTSKHVAPGFSGTPVWDSDKRQVAGIIVSIAARDNKISAHMIPVSILAEAWPNIIPRESAGVGRIESKMCDRDIEDIHFKKFFKSWRKECPNRPQIYIIQGNDDERHSSLIERFQETYVKEDLKIKPILEEIPWPFKGDWNVRKDILTESLFRKFHPKYDGDLTVSAFSTLIRNSKKGLMLVHDIDAQYWDRHTCDLIRWYFFEFWSALECSEDMPLVLIFINVIFPKSDIHGFKSLIWKSFRKQRIMNTVNRSLTSLPCKFHIFPELTPVTLRDVKDWFKNRKLDWDRYEDAFKSLCQKNPCISMKIIEPWLEEVVREIDRKMAGLQPSI